MMTHSESEWGGGIILLIRMINILDDPKMKNSDLILNTESAVDHDQIRKACTIFIRRTFILKIYSQPKGSSEIKITEDKIRADQRTSKTVVSYKNVSPNKLGGEK